FSLVRKLDFFTTMNEWEKLLKIELRPATLASTMTSLNVPGYVYLINENNQVEFSTDSSFNWRNGPVDFNQIKIEDDHFLFESSHFEGNPIKNWRMVAIVPESEVVYELKNTLFFVIAI